MAGIFLSSFFCRFSILLLLTFLWLEKMKSRSRGRSKLFSSKVPAAGFAVSDFIGIPPFVNMYVGCLSSLCLSLRGLSPFSPKNLRGRTTQGISSGGNRRLKGRCSKIFPMENRIVERITYFFHFTAVFHDGLFPVYFGLTERVERNYTVYASPARPGNLKRHRQYKRSIYNYPLLFGLGGSKAIISRERR